MRQQLLIGSVLLLLLIAGMMYVPSLPEATYEVALASQNSFTSPSWFYQLLRYFQLKPRGPSEITPTPISSQAGLGLLCSSLSECFVFCKNNVGRCQNYCKKNLSNNLCKPLPAAKKEEWKSNSITQPLPEGASNVRLVLPAPLDDILLSEIGAFGAHRGGHLEGLDHEWILVKGDGNKGVRSWGDGEIVWARPAPGDTGFEFGVRNVVIYYGDGLWGEHMGLLRVLVKEGQKVKAGELVGYGPTSADPPFGVKIPGYQDAEFNLMDQHRRGGVGYWYKFVKGGSFVSPFDYLRDDVKKELEARWQKEILDKLPLITNANEIVPTQWEPYLTNPLFIHQDHKNTLVGEWFLRSKPWVRDDAPDVMTMLAVQSPYYSKQKIIAGNEEMGSPYDFHGDWSADYSKGRIILETDKGTYYGIFELNESGPRAKLKIEYQKESYPQEFSSHAFTYTEREAISKSEERRYWAHPEDDPRKW